MVRAARLLSHDRPLEIQDVDLPAAGPDEVRVELAFAGVNPIDLYAARGQVAVDGPLPRTLGGEASGFLDGAPVLVAGAGLGAARNGVWASAAVVPATAVVPLPEGVGLPEAAAMGVAGLTAWDTVHLAELRPDDRVLVLGAGGGVGLPIVSLASASGATVWGQTGSERKQDAIRGHGAQDVVVTDAAHLADAVGPWEPTVVIDPLGGEFTAAALGVLAPRGRLVLFGTSSGPNATLNLRALYRKRLSLLGYGGLILSDDERRATLREALTALADGRLRIAVDRILPLDEVDRAFHLLSERATTGKIVLDVRQ
jgi:NADPH2:quinone reductase